MTNPTSNFGWQMPTSTDLVTDLPADFEVFGQAVDTDFVDLLGGASGYILSKASATDLDFTWIPNDQGDITAVTVTAPITGGGTSGSVGIAISAASTAASGAVQLSDSTSTTSSVLAATPTAVKSAFDLATAAIPKSLVTTAGDIIYRNATVPARLGIGTAGQVLAVNSGATAPEWIAAPSGNKTLAQVATGAMSSTSVTISSLSSYDTIILGLTGVTWGTAADNLRVRINSLTTSSYLKNGFGINTSRLAINQTGSSFALQDTANQANADANNNYFYIFTNCKNAGFTSVQAVGRYVDSTTASTAVSVNGVIISAETVSSLVIATSSAYTFSAGTYTVWGA
jgi:hypothetical protein